MSNYNPNYFRKGLLPLIILRLLKEKDMYGYEIIKTIEEQSHGVITVQEGALYPVLYQFSEAGYITEERIPHKKRMTRIFYHLEPSGVELLEKLTNEYYQVAEAMTMLLSFQPNNTETPEESAPISLQEEKENDRTETIRDRSLHAAPLLRKGETLAYIPN